VIRRRRGRRTLGPALAAALALALLGALAPAAGAHALLQRSVPERGAQLATAPDQVEMDFSEGVEIAFGAIKVYDATGRQVQTGEPFHPRGDASAVAVRVKPGGAQGGYTATYRVISADAHPVSGGFTFQVGQGGAATASVAQLLSGDGSGKVTSVAFAITRALEYAAIALALGVLAVLFLVWLPTVRVLGTAEAAWASATAAVAGRLRRVLLVAAGLGCVAALVALPMEAATAAGTSWFSAIGDVGEVLDTRFGVFWGLAALVWLVVGAVALLGASAALPVLRPATMGATGVALPRPAGWSLALLVPVLALATLPAFGGHASVQSPVAVLLPANVVHVLAAGAWIGGLAALVACLPAATRQFPAGERSAVLSAAMGRFSSLALLAVAALLVGGILQSVLQLSAVGDLLDTAWGRAVLIKILLVVALLSAGAVNRLRTLPALDRAAAAGEATGSAGLILRRTLRAEVLLGVAALAVTGALAGYAPADAQVSGPYSHSQSIGPAVAELTVDPALAGANEVHLYLFRKSDGRQYDAVRELTVQASLPSAGVPGIALPALKAGPGHYVLSSASFAQKGEWHLTITARVSDFDEYRSMFEVPIR
jgi:copper transport protein